MAKRNFQTIQNVTVKLDGGEVDTYTYRMSFATVEAAKADIWDVHASRNTLTVYRVEAKIVDKTTKQVVYEEVREL